MYIQKSYKDSINSLYVIPTPIGNLEDITVRSLNILKSLDILYCEDTRVTKKLISYYSINVQLRTYNDFSDNDKSKEVLNFLVEGKKVGLVSDAGMPGISDPGFKLINYLKTNNQNIVVLPGACAFLEPMVYFSFDSEPFIFRGFLSKQKSIYDKELTNICNENYNSIIYESPHRIEKTICFINELNLNNELLIAKEITKIYETYIQGNSKEILEYISKNKLKGEIVLIVSKPNIEIEVNYLELVEKLVSEGMSLKNATKDVSHEYNVSKNILYNEYLKNKK